MGDHHQSGSVRPRGVRMRGGLTALLVAVLGLGVLTPAAVADQGHHAFPTQHQVKAAKAKAAHRAQDVASIKVQLVLAQARRDAAQTRAEQASEAYNGAMWHLAEAKQQVRQAKKDAAKATAEVSAQRDAIGALVVESYQQGGDLANLTALLGASGPEGVMDSYAAFQSASTSLQADYQRFTATSALAKVFEQKAVRAQEHQQKLAQVARQARADAMNAASAAQLIQGQIAAQKDHLIHELAKAQNISVALAKQRQSALAEIARKAAEARARAEAAARARAAAKAAARAAAAAKAAAQQDNGSGPTSTDPVPPTDPTPPAPNAGAAKAIAYAEAQLGKPYQWGAAGPSTFDCSGLTMQAWRRGGIYLPHYSVAQYYSGTPISISSARPGDLIFFSSNGRPSGIHHVALYLGNGQFIEAPHTGAYVRYNSIFNWYPDFAVRL